VDSVGTILVKDVRKGRWDADQIIDEMFSVHARYKPDLFIVEQGTINQSIRPFLDKEMRKRNVYINLYPMVPTKDKMTRARSIQARMRAGGIRFDKDKSWYPGFEDEMARFPKDRHDDQVDALSWIGLALDKLVEAPTSEEEEEENYNHMLYDSEPEGMCLTTGY
jgi:predicted phage terminase large subunit-like protein